MTKIFRLAITLLCLAVATEVWAAPTTIAGWGDNSCGQLNVPPDLTNAVSIAAGVCHSLALKVDGTVVAWGGRNSRGPEVVTFSFGRGPREDGTKVPKDLTNVVAIAAGSDFSLALKADGTVIAWGDNAYGQTNLPSGLTNITAIAAGTWHCMALRSNGTVIAWGLKDQGDEVSRSIVPIEITNAVAIAAGASHNLVLKTDGTVVGWGQREWRAGVIPDKLQDVVAIAAGYNISLALKRDGTVIGWGFNRSGGATGNPSADKYPWTESGFVKIGRATLKDVTAVSAGKEYGLALKRDGTVVSWGTAPSHGNVNNAISIAAGERFCLVLLRGD